MPTSKDDRNTQSWLLIPAVKHTSHALRRVTKARIGFYKARTKTGIVTLQGYDGRKREMHKLHNDDIGIFTPQNKAYAPLGGDNFLRIEKGAATVSNHTVKKDTTALENIPCVPLNSKQGLPVSLDSFSESLLRIRLSDVNQLIVGRSQRIPLSVHIVMGEITGTPDLYVSTDKQLAAMGFPCKGSNVWETKEDLWIHPDNPEYCSGTYYLRICSGIDKCNLKVFVHTEKFIPTIAQARLGAGHGYRPSNAQKKTDFGHLVISTALGSASHRRIRGKMGQDPFNGFSMSALMKRPSSSPVPLQQQQSDFNHAQPQGINSQTDDFLMESADATEGPSSLQHALELSCKSSLGHIEFDHNSQISKICVRDFFSVLSRDKEPKSFELFVQRKQQAERWVHSPVKTPVEKETSPSEFRSPKKRLSTDVYSMLPTFKAALMELLRAADVCRNPIDRFRKPLTDCITISAPLAMVSGYAVVASDGSKNRNTSSRHEGASVRVAAGCACMVEHGSVVPPGADAVVEFRDAKLINENTVSICVPFQKGLNIEFEERPYFVQNGAFLPAHEYVESNFPGCLKECDTLFTIYYKSSKSKHELANSSSNNKQTDGSVEGNYEGLTTNILNAIDCSDSPIFKKLHGAERKKLAMAGKLHIANPETIIARKGEWIKLVGQPTRSVLLVISGDLRLSQSNHKPGAKMIEGKDTIVSAAGTVIGENQMFRQEQWAVQITAETGSVLVEFTLSAFAPLIFHRPEILEGFGLGDREQLMGQCQNHHQILGRSGIVSHGLLHNECTVKSFQALSECERKERSDRLDRFRSFMSLDPLHAMEVEQWWLEEKWNDALIQLGALSEADAAGVHERRRAYREQEAEVDRQIGGICAGDFVDSLRAASPCHV